MIRTPARSLVRSSPLLVAFAAACSGGGSGGGTPVLNLPPPVLFPTQGTEGTAIATFDANLDGRVDLAVANASSATVSVLLGRDSGLFEAPAVLAGPARASAVAAGDLDGDRFQELLAVGDLLPQLVVYDYDLQSGLQPPRTVALPRIVRDLVVGDVDGDGDADVVMTGAVDALLVVLRGDGTGAFGAPEELALTAAPSALAAADVDDDGRVDVMTALANGSLAIVSWAGGTANVRTQPLADQGLQTVVADVDGDRFEDLVVSCALRGDGVLFVLRNDGAGGFARSDSIMLGSPATSIAAVDLGGDGVQDVLAISGNRILASLGEGGGSFGGLQTVFTRPGGLAALTPIDLEADGRMDVAFVAGSDQVATVRNASAPDPGLAVYGSGTPGCDGAVATYADSAPTVGNASFTLLVRNAPPDTFGMLLRGGPQVPAGSDPFAIGLLFHVGFDLLFTDLVFSNGVGSAQRAMPIPGDPALAGFALFVQSLWLPDAGTSCSGAAMGLVSSRGLAVTIR